LKTQKIFPGANTLAYFSRALMRLKIKFTTLGLLFIKLRT
jgi:hypothetical protein